MLILLIYDVLKGVLVHSVAERERAFGDILVGIVI